MKNSRVLFWAISALIFISLLVAPLIFEDAKLSFEATKCERGLKENPQFASLHVTPCNRKFKGLLVHGRVASEQDFDLLEKHLRSFSSLSFSLSVNTGNRVREMYILKDGKKNGSPL